MRDISLSETLIGIPMAVLGLIVFLMTICAVQFCRGARIGDDDAAVCMACGMRGYDRAFCNADDCPGDAV